MAGVHRGGVGLAQRRGGGRALRLSVAVRVRGAVGRTKHARDWTWPLDFQQASYSVNTEFAEFAESAEIAENVKMGRFARSAHPAVCGWGCYGDMP